VRLERGYPGEAWLKGVTAAANELIRRGIADRDRLAVQGTSYGGYAVNLLVTQTDRFAAAVNVSGKVNMVSFYTDSPRLGTRNTHAPEASQDRIGGTLWEEPQKYLAHSAVLFADRIKTPMLLIGGDQDHNVPNRQLMEMYYALRRLGKDVTWVSYVHGGHGVPTTDEAMVRDYYQRILDFYAEHLAPAPEEGTTAATTVARPAGGTR
jgi:dipeptidyl aminopeptidase/acylaminoacyl peptidase